MHSPDLEGALQQVEQRMQVLAREDSGRAGAAAVAHLQSGGSRVRARLALHAALALGRPDTEAVAIAAACELLHNASLVHDDLQDRDPFRRGQPAVWRTHGDAAAICIGDLLLSAAYAALADCGASAAGLIAHTHRRVGAVIRGQCADLTLKGRADVSLATYEAVAADKSGPLLSLPLELALLLAGGEQYLARAIGAAERFAVAYQMTDDLEDVERDALNEELNVVAVLAAAGEPAPLQAAARLAQQRFAEARDAALTLPAGAGQLLADLAEQRMRSVAAVQVPA
jgi:geranylgeranyl pyrophosphate synthase